MTDDGRADGRTDGQLEYVRSKVKDKLIATTYIHIHTQAARNELLKAILEINVINEINKNGV